MTARYFPFCSLFLALWFPGSLATGQEKLPESWERDSTLRSVFFVDHDMGWAVGDRGIILKTEDGGRNWQSISSPRDLVWTSVFFINEKVGWITGGYFRGSLERSVGVMIRTIDGGKTWQNFSKNGIPFVRKIRFEDEQKGWLECDSNHLYPNGLLVTSDGGHEWRSPPGVSATQLKTGMKTSSDIFIGVDKENTLVKFDRQGMNKLQRLPFHQTDHLMESGNGQFLCIADGKIYRPSSDRPLVVGNRQTDIVRLDSLFHRDNQVWGVGSPGCVMVSSSDDGKMWSRLRTGQVESLKSVFFLNEERGWAVGALGKIIATKDGGKTWFPQRNPDLQVGILNIATKPELISTECIALLSGSFNHRCAVNLVGNDNTVGWANRLKIAEGLNRIGNSDFDIPSGTNDYLERLVRSIRTWKPAVVVVHDRDFILKEKIRLAVDAAANAEKYPELIDAGLQPWNVQKVVAVSESKELDSSVSINQYSAYLGRTVGLQARFANQLLSPEKDPIAKLNWGTLLSSTNSRESDQGMTTGTRAYSHPSCQLHVKQLQIKNMQQFRSIANWNQSLEQLGRYQVLSPIDEKAWNEQVTASTSGMDGLTQSFFLQDLAQKYTQLNKPVMADHTERLILQRLKDFEAWESTAWKMIQRYGSNESNHQLNSLVQKRIAQSNYQNKVGDSRVEQASANLPLDPVRPTGSSNESHIESVDVTPASLQNASQLVEIFQNRFPDHSADPKYSIPIAWLKQKLGNRAALDRFLDSTSRSQMDVLSKRRLERERQLPSADKRIKGSIQVQNASHEKIVLDGVLSESVWQIARRKYKSSQPNETGQKNVYYASDGEYFFVAGELELKSTPRQFNPQRRRLRDEELEGHERISFFLDFDRDYSSGMELSIDVRGSCNDSVWRDSSTKDYSFNPKWYVKTNLTGSTWKFECAIPLNELPTSVPQNESDWRAWVVGCRHLSANESTPTNTKQFLLDENILVIGRRPSEPIQVEQ